MNRLASRLGVLVVFLSCLVGSSTAQIHVSDDTHVTAGSTTPAGGANRLNVNIAVGNRTPASQAYLRLDLSRIPAGATADSVRKATLRLFVSQVATAGSFDVYSVLSPWDEATLVESNQPTLGPVLITGVSVTIKDRYLILDVTAAVKAWISGAMPNHGLALVPSSGSSLAIVLDSKETTATSHDASVQVDYTDQAVLDAAAATDARLAQEVLDRQNADVSAIAQANAYTNTTVNDEALQRTASDAMLQAQIASEAAQRAAEDTALRTTVSSLATLAGNTFSGSQSIQGDLTASGMIGAGQASSVSGFFSIGGQPFMHRFGSSTNTFTGVFAGNFSMSGDSNSGFGHRTLTANTTGVANTAVGSESLPQNTTGRGNTALGWVTLTQNQTGDGNTALGLASLFSLRAGDFNTAVGHEALAFATSDRNVGIGTSALRSNLDGRVNTAVGTEAGDGNISGSSNTFVGFRAQPSAPDLENASAFGANASVAASNALILGNNANVGIGTSAPSARLDVVGDAKVSGSMQAASFTGDGSALTGIATPAAIQAESTRALLAESTLSSSIAAETTRATAVEALLSNTLAAQQSVLSLLSVRNGNDLYVGRSDATLPAGGENTVVGLNSYSSSIGQMNTVVGSSAMPDGSDAHENVAVGWSALRNNLRGGQNVAVGNQALGNNTSGSANTALGASALANNSTGIYNVALGHQSLTQNSTGSANVAVGQFALNSATTASENVAIGRFAGRTLQTGAGNTFIGAYSSGADNISGSTAIGTYAHVSVENAIVLGNNANVGIGTSSPARRLDVVGDASISGSIYAAAFRGDGSALTGVPTLAAMQDETTRALAAEATLGSAIGDEIARAVLAEATLAASIANSNRPQVNPQKVALQKWYAAMTPVTVATAQQPAHLAFDGQHMWSTNETGSSVTKIRASDGSVIATYPTDSFPFGIAFDGANMWVACYGTNSVVKLRASDGVRLATYPVGGSPRGVVFDGTHIWVANHGSGTITKIRSLDGANLGTFQAGPAALHLIFDGSHLWVATAIWQSGTGSVLKIDPANGSVTGSYAIAGGNPIDLAFDGSHIWVSEYNNGTVTKLRASDGANLGTFAVDPEAIAVAFDGESIWVSSWGTGSVSKFQLDGAKVGTFAVGVRPTGLAFDGANIWVANGSGTIKKM